MKVVRQYQLSTITSGLWIPPDAQILSVRAHEWDLVLDVLEDTSATMAEERRIHCVEQNLDFPDEQAGRFLGTVQCDDRVVYVFEERRAE